MPALDLTHVRATGRYPKAVADGIEALRLDARDARSEPGSWTGDEWIHRVEEFDKVIADCTAAIVDFGKVLELDPNDRFARDNLERTKRQER